MAANNESFVWTYPGTQNETDPIPTEPLYFFKQVKAKYLDCQVHECYFNWTDNACENLTIGWSSEKNGAWPLTLGNITDNTDSYQFTSLPDSIFNKTSPSNTYGFNAVCDYGNGTDDVFWSQRFYVSILDWDYGKGVSTAPLASSGLAKGKVAGIAVASVAGVVVVLGLLFWCCRRKRNRRSQQIKSSGMTENFSPSPQYNTELDASGAASPAARQSILPERTISRKPIAKVSAVDTTSSASPIDISMGTASSTAGRYGNVAQNLNPHIGKQVLQAEYDPTYPEHLPYKTYYPQEVSSDPTSSRAGTSSQLDYDTSTNDKPANVPRPLSQGPSYAELGSFSHSGSHQSSSPHMTDFSGSSNRVQMPQQQHHEVSNLPTSSAPSQQRQTLAGGRGTSSLDPSSSEEGIQPPNTMSIHALKAQQRELEHQMEVDSSLQRLRAEHAAITDRLKLAEMQAREQHRGEP